MTQPLNHLASQFIYTELAEIVGNENITSKAVDKIAYSADFSWISHMWIDRGQRPPVADFIVFNSNSSEVAERI